MLVVVLGGRRNAINGSVDPATSWSVLLCIHGLCTNFSPGLPDTT